MAPTITGSGPSKSVWPGAAWIVFLLWAAIPFGAPAQTLTTLATFDGTNGANPKAPLIQANGNFYGTTSAGGANGFGSIFSITPGGTLTTLYSFTGAADGATPLAPLVQGIGGNFFGTASAGGTGSGTVFSITPAGTFTVLYTFTGALDGGVPLGGLAQDDAGTLYGTTSVGGANSNAGTVFSLASSAQGYTFATLYNFCGAADCADGATPEAGLVQGRDGNFLRYHRQRRFLQLSELHHLRFRGLRHDLQFHRAPGGPSGQIDDAARLLRRLKQLSRRSRAHFPAVSGR